LAWRGSMALETVFSGPDKLDFLRRAKEAGSFVRLFLVGADDPSINAARVAWRVMNGGHAVPIDKIIGRHPKSIANCAVAASFVDRAYVYDNSLDGRAPHLFRSVDGEIAETIGVVNDWAGRS
jgi:predicted ABC-type ATPase